jgi:glycine betaine/proline transport system substrate-binding protein
MLKGQKRKYKILIVALIVALTAGLVVGCSNSQQPSADKGTINIGYVNWAECVATSNLWKVILEEQGYTVKLTQLDVAPVFVGLSKGDIDFFMDAWLPITHQTYWRSIKTIWRITGFGMKHRPRLALPYPSM